MTFAGAVLYPLVSSLLLDAKRRQMQLRQRT